MLCASSCAHSHCMFYHQKSLVLIRNVLAVDLAALCCQQSSTDHTSLPPPQVQLPTYLQYYNKHNLSGMLTTFLAYVFLLNPLYSTMILVSGLMCWQVKPTSPPPLATL